MNQSESTHAFAFGAAEAALLRRHLQALVDVELLTIPLYLTATYSFTERALKYSPDGGRTLPLFDAQQRVLSVAVQEMYHLQLACNLCNAFAVTPELPRVTLQPGTPCTVPHVAPDGAPVVLQLGNLPTMLDALIAIEKAACGTFPPPNQDVVYPSIAALYHATLQQLKDYLQSYRAVDEADDPHFVANNNQVAYGTFDATYNYNKIHKRAGVASIANAIVDQGEGHTIAQRLGVPYASGDDVLPQFQPKEGSRFAHFGAVSHFRRFCDVRDALVGENWERRLGGAAFYSVTGNAVPELPAWAPPLDVLQANFSLLWSGVIDAMQRGFACGKLGSSDDAGPSFGELMLSFKYLIPLLWKSGAAPAFAYRPDVTPIALRGAMDAVDPLCLFHWDEETARLRQTWKENGVALNACQGLNGCKGMGWGGIATEPGNGACATADLHVCGANNDCRAQGGCGYLVSVSGEACNQYRGQLLPPAEEWNAGDNGCHNLGGCQAPISPGQVFNRLAAGTIADQRRPEWTDEEKQRLEALIGTNVWDRARRLLAAKLNVAELPAPREGKKGAVDYDGTRRRNAISPTSK